MNLATILRTHPWLPSVGMLAGLLAIVLNGFGMVRPLPGSGMLMRWHDAGRDWLLVADDEANQLAEQYVKPIIIIINNNNNNNNNNN